MTPHFEQMSPHQCHGFESGPPAHRSTAVRVFPLHGDEGVEEYLLSRLRPTQLMPSVVDNVLFDEQSGGIREEIHHFRLH